MFMQGLPPSCVRAVACTGSGATALHYRLLSSFSSGLEEVTIIAYGGSTQAQGQGAAASSAVQLHSFLDPQKGALQPPCCETALLRPAAWCTQPGQLSTSRG